jgi:hypothetical protein
VLPKDVAGTAFAAPGPVWSTVQEPVLLQDVSGLQQPTDAASRHVWAAGIVLLWDLAGLHGLVLPQDVSVLKGLALPLHVACLHGLVLL